MSRNKRLHTHSMTLTAPMVRAKKPSPHVLLGKDGHRRGIARPYIGKCPYAGGDMRVVMSRTS